MIDRLAGSSDTNSFHGIRQRQLQSDPSGSVAPPACLWRPRHGKLEEFAAATLYCSPWDDAPGLSKALWAFRADPASSDALLSVARRTDRLRRKRIWRYKSG